MNRTILIVEDDALISEMIAEALDKSGYKYKQAYSGTEAQVYIDAEDYDLILLDLMLPGKNGSLVLKELRNFSQVPVIVISAKDELDSKVDLLKMGAEDYITKPFELRELLARIEVQLRSKAFSHANRVLKYKDLSLCLNSLSIKYQTKSIMLTKLEFQILETFFKQPEKIFSKQELYSLAWSDFYIGEDKTVNVHISNIRQKLKKLSKQDYIETVWGIGFRLI